MHMNHSIWGDKSQMLWFPMPASSVCDLSGYASASRSRSTMVDFSIE